MTPEEQLHRRILVLSKRERLLLAADMLKEVESEEHDAARRLHLLGMVRSILDRISGEIALIEITATHRKGKAP